MSDASARYDVEIAFKKVGDGWDDLSSGVGKFTGVLDAAMGRIGRFAEYAAVGLGAGLFAGAIMGVTKLNAEAEGAAISIGTIFSVNGLANNVPQGIVQAREQIAKMRVDAQSLPGTFEDLQKIYLTAASPLFQSGASEDQARKLSAQVMAASAVLQVPADMAAREFAQLISGRAGAHNVLGTRMGYSGAKAKELNAESPEKRLASVTTELGKFSGAIDEFSHSYVGLSTTFKNNVEGFGRASTASLFQDVKDTLADINDWFGHNKSTVDAWSLRIGNDLHGAFEFGKKEIEEWEPPIENFVGTAVDRIESLWDDVQPGVQAFGQAMKDALSDPNGTIDKLVHLGEIYAGLSLGGGLVGALGSKTGRIGSGLELAAGGIAGAAIGADQGNGKAEAAEAGASVGGGALAGSQVGGVTGAMVGAATGALAYMAAAYKNYAAAKAAADEHLAQNSYKLAIDLFRANEEINRNTGTNVLFGTTLENNARRIEGSGNAVEAAFLRVHASAIEVAAGLDSMFGKGGDEHTKSMGVDLDKQYGLAMFGAINNFVNGVSTAEKKKAPTMKGGHGGTSIQKVEIVVTSNQSPSRIARAVHAELAKLTHNRRVSPYVRNYSARDE